MLSYPALNLAISETSIVSKNTDGKTVKRKSCPVGSEQLRFEDKGKAVSSSAADKPNEDLMVRFQPS